MNEAAILKPPRKSYKWRRAMRATLRSRDGCMCHWCGEAMIFPDGRSGMNQGPRVVSIDHLLERRNGGTDDLVNLVLACHDCNRGRDRWKAVNASRAALTPMDRERVW